MKLNAPLFPIALALMAGIALSVYLPQWHWALLVLFPLVTVTCLLNRWPRCQEACIMLSTLVIGMALGARNRQQLEVSWPAEQVQKQLVVINEPVLKEKWVVVDVLTADDGRKLRCRIARDSLSSRIVVGDGLSAYLYIKNVRDWRAGHYDYRRYMQCHGFVGEALVFARQWRWQQVPLSGLSVVQRARLRFLCWRHQLLEHFRQWHFSDEHYGVVAAMTLGDRSQLDAQIQNTYSQVGASHILALSGLHLMILYAVITLFLGWIRHQLFTQVVIALSVWAFAFLVGLSPSVTRSAFMISLYAILSVGHRDRMSVNVLAFAAIVMLSIHPYVLYDMGFQMSFMAVLAILLFHPLFGRIVPPHVLQRHRWLGAVWGLVTVSLSAQVGTAPLVAYYFGRFSCYFLLTNFIVIPSAYVILMLTLACLVVSSWPWAADLLAQGLEWTVGWMNRLLAAIAHLPGCTVEGISLSGLQLLLIYVALASAWVFISIRYRESRRSV